MDIDSVMSKLNPVMVWILESRLHGLLSSGLMVMHIQGVRSGKRYKIPVGYQRHGDAIEVLVSKSTRKNWWRNFRSPNAVEIVVKGNLLHGTAERVEKNTDKFETMVTYTFDRVPGLSRQFGIVRRKGEPIASEGWQAIRADAELVEIKLQ